MKVSDIMYTRRRELGLTLQQVGDAVGVDKNTVRRWELGFIANMRRDRIARLAEVLQVKPTDFVGENDSPEIEETALRIWAKPLVDAYREAPEHLQRAICEILQIEPLNIPKVESRKKKGEMSDGGDGATVGSDLD